MIRRTLTAAALLAALTVPAHADDTSQVPTPEEHTALVSSLLPVYDPADTRMAETVAQMEALEAEVAALYPTSSIREDRPAYPSLPSTGVHS